MTLKTGYFFHPVNKENAIRQYSEFKGGHYNLKKVKKKFKGTIL